MDSQAPHRVFRTTIQTNSVLLASVLLLYWLNCFNKYWIKHKAVTSTDAMQYGIVTAGVCALCCGCRRETTLLRDSLELLKSHHKGRAGMDVVCFRPEVKRWGKRREGVLPVKAHLVERLQSIEKSHTACTGKWTLSMLCVCVSVYVYVRKILLNSQ